MPQDQQTLVIIGIIAGSVVLSVVLITFVISRLYRRASKETSLVRTGLGGQRVVMNGGALVLPVFHETIPVNMNTLRLEVGRSREQALITRDRMRVDVQAEFYVRVKPTDEAIASAAQTLGRRTLDPQSLKELVEGKFVDALRAVAAEMAMEELHEQRVQFVQKVQSTVSEDLLKNGLELETVSLTALDQTSQEFFNAQNAFDAQGLTKLTEEIQARRKQRNDIEQETRVLIETRNLDAEQKSLQIARESEYARMEQEREVAIRRAALAAEIAKEQAARHQEAEEARIAAEQMVKQANLSAQLGVDQTRIETEKLTREQDVLKNRAVAEAEIAKAKAVELAEQDRAIAIAEKSRAQSEAQAEANRALALAVQAEEGVITTREVETAERRKRIELLQASELAERDAIRVKVAAEAERDAALSKGQAVETLAKADAQRAMIAAEADASAEKVRAEAAAARYTVEAEGKRAIHEAENILTAEIIAMKIRQAVIERLPDIIRESVKPMERIEGIKILHVDGLGGGGLSGGGGSHGDAGFADAVVSSALRYRSQAPLIDSLLAELGLQGKAAGAISPQLLGEPGPGDKVEAQLEKPGVSPGA